MKKLELDYKKNDFANFFFVLSTVMAYDPSIAEYDPSIAEYDPSIAEYDPSIADYDPNIADYDPSIADYDRDDFKSKFNLYRETVVTGQSAQFYL